MKAPVLCLCGLLLAALPAAAGDLKGDYDRQVDKTDIDGSDLDTSGMDVNLNSAGLSEGDDATDMDTQVDWSDTDPTQDTNDLDVPPVSESATVPYEGPVPADSSGRAIPEDLSNDGKWPAAELPPEPTYPAE
ncbi:MAG: hypothetical protein AAF495_18510 [Pseudomonadota bacterium]